MVEDDGEILARDACPDLRARDDVERYPGLLGRRRPPLVSGLDGLRQRGAGGAAGALGPARQGQEVGEQRREALGLGLGGFEVAPQGGVLGPSGS